MQSPNAGALMSNWLDWTTLIANLTTIVAFAGGTIAAIAAGKKYFREKTHERVIHLYSLTNALFRAELTIQHLMKKNAAVDPTTLSDARANLKNWYYDNRFLFQDDKPLKPLIEAADDEADHFVRKPTMDALMKLKQHLEEQLPKAP